jgi:hypothetical protein
MGLAWSLELFCVQKCYTERDGEVILTLSRATMGQRGQLPSTVRQTPPPADIRIESGDIIEDLEDSAYVAPEVEDLPDGIFRGIFRWR